MIESIHVTRLGGKVLSGDLVKLIDGLFCDLSKENLVHVLTVSSFSGIPDLMGKLYDAVLNVDKKSINICLKEIDNIHYEMISSFKFSRHTEKIVYSYFLEDFYLLKNLVKNKKNQGKKNEILRVFLLFFGDMFASKIVEQVISNIFRFNTMFIGCKEIIKTNGISGKPK